MADTLRPSMQIQFRASGDPTGAGSAGERALPRWMDAGIARLARHARALLPLLPTWVALATLLMASPAPAEAQDSRIEEVRFDPGRAGIIIEDTISDREQVLYRIDVEAGQRMRIALDPSNLATYFNVYGPGRGPGDEALATGGLTGPLVPELNRFESELSEKGTYTISVYLLRSAGRMGQSSDYMLEIAVGSGASSALQTSPAAEAASTMAAGRVEPVAQQGAPTDDATDGGGEAAADREAPSAEASAATASASASAANDAAITVDTEQRQMGEPEFWQVNTSGGALNVRAWPAEDAQRRGQFDRGTVLQNLGCRNAGDRRWCEVATLGEDLSGWVAADFLVATRAGPDPATPPAARTERVAFTPGSAASALQGDVGEGDAVNYVLDATVGQVLQVRLSAADPGLHFNVLSPRGDVLYDTVGGASPNYRGQVFVEGEHTVQVYNRGDANAPYELELQIE